MKRILSPKHHRHLEHKRNKYKRTEKDSVSSDKEEEKDKDTEKELNNIDINNTTDEENDMPIALDDERKKRKVAHNQNKPLNMSNHAILGQVFVLIILFSCE